MRISGRDCATGANIRKYYGPNFRAFPLLSEYWESLFITPRMQACLVGALLTASHTANTAKVIARTVRFDKRTPVVQPVQFAMAQRSASM